METTVNKESEVKLWLKCVLANENFQHFSVTITGGSEKGDGYSGDIIFADVVGTNKQGLNKEYNLVLKCSTSSEALIKTNPTLLEVYNREIYIYDKVFSYFRKFELDRGIRDPFDSVPKYYGMINSELKKVVVFENLKKIDYDLWSINKPLTLKHVELVVKEYAKFHAISVAMKEQEPENFRTLVNGFDYDVLRNLFKNSDFPSIFEQNVNELYTLLKDDLEEHTMKKWLSFKEQIRFICFEMSSTTDDLEVIIHGDCWNNNFMYKYQDEDKSVVSKVAILDWQASKFSTPVLDLSYFLFSCISGEDVPSLNTILKTYHESLCDYSSKLGSTLIRSYTFEKFLAEWKKYSRYGIMMCMLAIKIGYTDKEDLPDVAKNAESGEDISKSFNFILKDKTGFVSRIKPIIQHAVEFELI